MNRIKEIIDQITKRGWITGGSIALIVLIIGVSVFYSKNQNAWPLSMFQNNEIVEETETEERDDIVKKATDAVFTKEDIINGEYRNDVRSATTYVRNTREVKVAVVISENQSGDTINAQNISCGEITFVTARVTGPAVLTNTLKSMFANTVKTDFVPGNIIPTYHPELTLQNVRIENGVAKIYLGGNFTGTHDGWCDSSLAIAQITETAKAFSTVQSAEVYQNGSRVY